MIQGNEIFIIQRTLYKRLGGIFGIGEKKRTDIAVALDAAVLFGALAHKQEMPGVGGIHSQTLEDQLREKMNRIGAL